MNFLNKKNWVLWMNNENNNALNSAFNETDDSVVNSSSDFNNTIIPNENNISVNKNSKVNDTPPEEKQGGAKKKVRAGEAAAKSVSSIKDLAKAIGRSIKNTPRAALQGGREAVNKVFHKKIEPFDIEKNTAGEVKKFRTANKVASSIAVAPLAVTAAAAALPFVPFAAAGYGIHKGAQKVRNTAAYQKLKKVISDSKENRSNKRDIYTVQKQFEKVEEYAKKVNELNSGLESIEAKKLLLMNGLTNEKTSIDFDNIEEQKKLIETENLSLNNKMSELKSELKDLEDELNASVEKNTNESSLSTNDTDSVKGKEEFLNSTQEKINKKITEIYAIQSSLKENNNKLAINTELVNLEKKFEDKVSAEQKLFDMKSNKVKVQGLMDDIDRLDKEIEKLHNKSQNKRSSKEETYLNKLITQKEAKNSEVSTATGQDYSSEGKKPILEDMQREIDSKKSEIKTIKSEIKDAKHGLKDAMNTVGFYKNPQQNNEELRGKTNFKTDAIEDILEKQSDMKVKQYQNAAKGLKHYQKAEKPLGVEGQGMESVKAVMSKKVEATQDYHNEHNKGKLKRVINFLATPIRLFHNGIQDGFKNTIKDLTRSSGTKSNISKFAGDLVQDGVGTAAKNLVGNDRGQRGRQEINKALQDDDNMGKHVNSLREKRGSKQSDTKVTRL